MLCFGRLTNIAAYAHLSFRKSYIYSINGLLNGLNSIPVLCGPNVAALPRRPLELSAVGRAVVPWRLDAAALCCSPR